MAQRALKNLLSHKKCKLQHFGNNQSVNIIIAAMYFASAIDLQNHLSNDWNILLKNLKIRQDNHFQLLQYNHKIIAKQRKQQSDLFINDEIIQHHSKIKSMTDMIKFIEEEQKTIKQKYQSTVVNYEQITKMMGRIAARVLEICHFSLDRCKGMDDQIAGKYGKMKNSLMRQINQKNKVDLEGITNGVIDYSHQKFANEVEKLKRVVIALENGQFQKLRQVYEPKQKFLSTSVQKKPQKTTNSIQKTRISSVGRQEKSQKKQIIKAVQKLKKQRQKIAVRLAHGLYSMMDLSKQQFIEEMVCNEKEKTTRLYNDFFLRNKTNYEQIKAFEAKRDEFQQKVRLFKEMMERQSRKLEEGLKRVPSAIKNKRIHEETEVTVNDVPIVEQFTNIQISNNFTEDFATQKKISQKRYRIQDLKIKKDFLDLAGNIFPSFHIQENYNHLKFDITNQQFYPRTNRNKLPQINNQNNLSHSINRAISLDQKCELNRSKIYRTNKQMRPFQGQINNIQQIEQDKVRGKRIDRQPQTSVRASKKQGESAEKIMKKRQSNPLMREKQKIDPKPMEFTFYVRQTNNKFYTGKLNALV